MSAASLHLVAPPDDETTPVDDAAPAVSARFQAIWPVVDRTMSLSDLIPEARADLPGMLARHRVQLVHGLSSVRWSIRLGRDVPGSAGAVEVLVADCPVAQVPADVDTITGQRDGQLPALRGPRAGRS